MKATVTRAAEGFDRRSFTVAEVLRMQETGIISDDENFELIEGEIVPMQAKTHVHELIKSKAGAWEHIVERGPDDVLTCAALPGFSAKLGAI